MADRVSKDAWLIHGFEVLKKHGHKRLKAEPMAKELGVSRGSFYWHFTSLAGFHVALLQAWREKVTESVILDLEKIPQPRARLIEINRRALGTPQDLERAMRRWSGQNEAVYSEIKDIDSLRLNFLTKLFVDAGFPPSGAKSRAALLMWAFIGRSFAPDFVQALDAEDPESLGRIFWSNSQ